MSTFVEQFAQGSGLGQGGAGVVIPPAELHVPQSFEELELPAAFRPALQETLTKGEKILWLGRPSRNPQALPGTAAATTFGFVLITVASTLGGMAVFGQWGLATLGFAGVLGIIGVVALLPSWTGTGGALPACYVVTDRRAIVLQMSALQRASLATSYYPHQLLGMERRLNSAVPGAGDLVFEQRFAVPGQTFDPNSGVLVQGTGFGATNTAQRAARGFLGLDQVCEVEQLIRSALLQSLEAAMDRRLPADAVAAACDPESCPSDRPIAPDLKAKALAHVASGETLVWMGQPVPGFVVVRNAGYILGGAFGLALAGWILSLALAAGNVAGAHGQAKPAARPPVMRLVNGRMVNVARQSQKPDLLLAGGLLAIAAGVAAVPLLRWHVARRTCYVLTSRRALVYKEGLFGPTVESYSPAELAEMRWRASWIIPGCGDVIFRTVQVITRSYNRFGGNRSVKTTHYGFLAIADASEVERRIRETLVDPFAQRLCRANAL